MARPKGRVVERRNRAGVVTSYGLRFYLGGERHYVTADATTEAGARAELDAILGAASLGLWTPPTPAPAIEPAAQEDAPPSFADYSATWLDGRRPEIRPRTIESLSWQLERHLRPHFAGYRIDQIRIADVDAFKVAKLQERERTGNGLGNAQINRCLATLAGILDAAKEHGHVTGDNPARGRRRRLKQERPERSFLEKPQLEALLDATSDPEHAALLGTMALAGLRVGEATALRWRDVRLGAGRISIRQAKTSAGVREAKIGSALHDLLAEHRANTPDATPATFVFRTSNGTPRDRRNVAKNVLLPAVKRANQRLEEAGDERIEHASPHTLRHTFISHAHAKGIDLAWIMKQVGHTSPTMTLGVYAHAVADDSAAVARLDAIYDRGAPTRAQTPGTNPDDQLEDALAELLADD